jgi:uncharacterized protein DUF4279
MSEVLNEGEVYFALTCDRDFDPAIITDALGIEPSRTRRKAEPIPKISGWYLSSGEVISEVIDVFEMSTALVARLTPKTDQIKCLIAEHGLTAHLEVVLWITMDDTKSTPAIGFEPSTIHFLSAVGAYIDIDTYRNV